MHPLLAKLTSSHRLSFDEWCALLASADSLREEAAMRAREETLARFGQAIFYRGIVEFSNYCKNPCFYCGLQAGNTDLSRFRLENEEIIEACAKGYEGGVRTFVLQSGEDPGFDDARLCSLITELVTRFPDAAVTLSIGERSRESYEALFKAGARRYLLRHEAANPILYGKVHGPQQFFWHRISCLYTLKELGYQTGCGMMIGLPGQSIADLACDLSFIQDFRPHMIGIGPFLPHHATVFANEKEGSAELSLYILSLCRLLLPDVLLPATTALRSECASGFRLGVLAGCNVVMPSLTPQAHKRDYLLYDKKKESGSLSQTLAALGDEVADLGYKLVVSRGDHVKV